MFEPLQPVCEALYPGYLRLACHAHIAAPLTRWSVQLEQLLRQLLDCAAQPELVRRRARLARQDGLCLRGHLGRSAAGYHVPSRALNTQDCVLWLAA